MSKRREFIKTAAAAGLALASTGAQAHGEDNDDFIRTVLRARIFDLSHTWDENSPIAGVNPPYAMALNATHATPAEDPGRGTRGSFGDGGQLSFTSEIQRAARCAFDRRPRPYRP
jgi:hypothetical protein